MQRKRSILTITALVTFVAAAVFAFSSGRGTGSTRELRASEVMGHPGVAVDRAATGPITRREAQALEPLAAAPGWAGEIKVGTEDTWEPSVAADPSGPYVYVMYNRFGGPKACKSCPPIPMLLRVSSDNGLTWGAETYPCPCPGVKQFQYDPVVKVASNGVVYATWMNKYDMVFSKSTNHGATWTAPIEVSGSAVGRQAVDRREPRRRARLHRVRHQFRRVGGGLTQLRRVVLPRGEAQQRQRPLPLPERPRGARERHRRALGIGLPGWHAADDRARSTSRPGAPRTAASRGRARCSARCSRASTSRHPRPPRSAATLPARSWRSTRARRARAATVTSGRVARPTEASRGRRPSSSARARPTRASRRSRAARPGIFRIHYADDRTGAWNTFYRSSTDGGQTWSAEVDISDADTGATYKTAAGFASAYGDYGAIDITNTGKTVAVWGEGVSFSTGPGGIWFNRLAVAAGGSSGRTPKAQLSRRSENG